MKNYEDSVTTRQLADMLSIHEYSVSKLCGAAFVSRADAYSDKYYSLKIVAETASQASGFKVRKHHLHGLLTGEEAVQLLTELGKPRKRATLNYWMRIGYIHVVRIGTGLRFLRSEIVSMADQLPVTLRQRIRQNPGAGAFVGVSASGGHGGGSHLISLPDQGA